MSMGLQHHFQLSDVLNNFFDENFKLIFKILERKKMLSKIAKKLSNSERLKNLF